MTKQHLYIAAADRVIKELIEQYRVTGRVTQVVEYCNLSNLSSLRTAIPSGDKTIDLSRGDYKICDSIFKKEIEENGFKILKRKTIGPVDTIGGMAVYVLGK